MITINDIAKLTARVNVLISHYEQLSDKDKETFRNMDLPIDENEFINWKKHANEVQTNLYDLVGHNESLVNGEFANREIKI